MEPDSKTVFHSGSFFLVQQLITSVFRQLGYLQCCLSLITFLSRTYFSAKAAQKCLKSSRPWKHILSISVLPWETGYCMNTKSSAKSEQCWLFHKIFSYVCLCLCSSECGRDSLGKMWCHVLICTNQNVVFWLVQSRWSSRLAHFWSVKVAIIFI